MENILIRCPRCKWEPDGKPYWQCTCKHIWNTFATGARCPKCGKVWEDTACPSAGGGCKKWSPHLDWYEGLDEMVEALKKEIKEKWLLAARSLKALLTLGLDK